MEDLRIERERKEIAPRTLQEGPRAWSRLLSYCGQVLRPPRPPVS